MCQAHPLTDVPISVYGFDPHDASLLGSMVAKSSPSGRVKTEPPRATKSRKSGSYTTSAAFRKSQKTATPGPSELPWVPRGIKQRFRRLHAEQAALWSNDAAEIVAEWRTPGFMAQLALQLAGHDVPEFTAGDVTAEIMREAATTRRMTEAQYKAVRRRVMRVFHEAAKLAARVERDDESIEYVRHERSARMKRRGKENSRRKSYLKRRLSVLKERKARNEARCAELEAEAAALAETVAECQLAMGWAGGRFAEASAICIAQGIVFNRICRITTHTVKTCHARAIPTTHYGKDTGHPGMPGIAVHLDGEGRRIAAYVHIVRCASVWFCPVCGPKIQFIRREEMRQALEKWLELHPKGVILFATWTAPHTADDFLPVLLLKQQKVWKLFRGGKAWQNFKKNWGLCGYIRAAEATWGHVTGWHAHYHEVMLFDADWTADCVAVGNRPAKKLSRRLREIKKRADASVAELKSFLRERWINGCISVGLANESQREDMRLHATDFRVGRDPVDFKYLSKSSPWEMASMTTKAAKSPGRYHPFEILALATDLRRSDRREWLRRWMEYMAGYMRRASIYWSPGLKKELGIVDRTDEEIINSEGGETEYLVTRGWNSKQAKLLRGSMLVMARNRRRGLHRLRGIDIVERRERVDPVTGEVELTPEEAAMLGMSPDEKLERDVRAVYDMYAPKLDGMRPVLDFVAGRAAPNGRLWRSLYLKGSKFAELMTLGPGARIAVYPDGRWRAVDSGCGKFDRWYFEDSAWEETREAASRELRERPWLFFTGAQWRAAVMPYRHESAPPAMEQASLF